MTVAHRHLLLALTWLVAGAAPGLVMAAAPSVAPTAPQVASVWDKYKRIRQGESSVDAQEEEEPPAPAATPAPPPAPPPAPAAPAPRPAPATPAAGQPPVAAAREPATKRQGRVSARPVSAPAQPVAAGSWWAFYAGTLDIDARPFYGPYGVDFQWAYARSEPLPPDPRIVVSLHDAGDGEMGVFAPDAAGDIELRTQDAGVYRQDWREGWSLGADGQPYPGRRIAATLQFLAQRYALEPGGRGIVVQGAGMGGSGALLQTLLLPQPWRARIAYVSAQAGGALPRQVARKQPQQFANLPPDSGAGRQVWDRLDFQQQAPVDPVLRGMHYRQVFSSDDPSAEGPRGNTQLAFVNLLETQRIGAAFAWVKAGRGTYERGVRMPDLSRFEVPEQDVPLDRAHPAITRSTGNYPPSARQRVDGRAFPRGHYNLGITWDHAGIVDRPGEIVFPLRYTARRNLGQGLPDQPRHITVSVTPRRPRHFELRDGETLNWSWDGGALTGSATVRGDSVTIDGIPLESGQPYRRLRIYR